MTVVEEDLKNCIKEYKLLKSEKDALGANAQQLDLDLKHTKIQKLNAEEELKQASEIASGKPYLLLCIFGSRADPGLTRVWRSLVAFPDLPTSAIRACHFNNGSQDNAHGEARQFWLQFQCMTQSMVLTDKLKQLEELHKLARQAM